MFGIGLHALQDSFPHEGCSPPIGHWHPKKSSMFGLGHDGHECDWPHLHRNKAWQTAVATYDYLDRYSRAQYGRGCGVSLASFKANYLAPFQAMFSFGNPDERIRGINWSLKISADFAMPAGSFDYVSASPPASWERAHLDAAEAVKRFDGSYAPEPKLDFDGQQQHWIRFQKNQVW